MDATNNNTAAPCSSCHAPFSDYDDTSRESKTRPGTCVGCDGHLLEVERRDRIGFRVAVRTNESHDPRAWRYVS